MNTLKRFFLFLFSKEKIDIVRIGKVHVSKDKKSIKEKEIRVDRRTQIGVIISYLMSFLLASSFISILIFIFFKPEQQMPTIIQDVFFGMLGYFGGAFSSFLKFENQ